MCCVDMFSARKTIKKSNLKDISVSMRVVAGQLCASARTRSLHLATSSYPDLCRKYSKFSYVLCRCLLMRECAQLNITKRYFTDTIPNAPFEPIALSTLHRYPQCNLAAFSTSHTTRLLSARQLPTEVPETTKQFQKIKVIIFCCRIWALRTTALYESKNLTKVLVGGSGNDVTCWS